jgi:hypothetical protein
MNLLLQTFRFQSPIRRTRLDRPPAALFVAAHKLRPPLSANGLSARIIPA